MGNLKRSLKPLNLTNFFNSKRMYEYISNIASFGPRNSGSEGDQKTVNYLTNILNNWGFKILFESCNTTDFQFKESVVKILNPYSKFINSICHYRSGTTNNVIAKLKYVAYGEEVDYKDKEVEGNILLADIGKIHPIPKADLAYKFGAIACIWPHFSPGNRIAAWGLHQDGAKLPVLGISYEDGLLLKKLLGENSVVLEIKALANFKKGTQDHMIIDIKGRDKPEDVFVLLAHRDTVYNTPGANDNASGVAVLLEIARFFSMVRPKRTLRIIFSAAEEGGGFGIQQYIDKNEDQIKKRVKGVINLDMVGAGEKLCIVSGGYHGGKRVTTSNCLNEKIMKIAQSFNYKLGGWECPFGLADIGPFCNIGIPSAWLYQTGYQYYHTNDDNIEHIDPNNLKTTCDIVGKTILEMLEE